MPDSVGITSVSQLIDVLQRLQRENDDTERVHFQVVGDDHASGAWYMGCEVGVVPQSSPVMVVLSLSHPLLKALPIVDFDQPEKGTKYGGTCAACGVRTELIHQCPPKVPDDICAMCGEPDASTIHPECM